jgi:hypothetical protein
MAAIDVYNVNKQGQIVLHGKVWSPPYGVYKLALSVYAYTGIKSKKRTPPLVREWVPKYVHNDEVLHIMLHNYAHLWAMQNGVSDFEFRSDRFDTHKELLHPTQYKENQS